MAAPIWRGSKVVWSKKLPADENNRVSSGLNSVLVRTGDMNILIETGIGNKLPEKMAQFTASLPSFSTASMPPASHRTTSISSSTRTSTSITADGTQSSATARLSPRFPKRSTTCRKANGVTPTKTSATVSAI